MIAILVSVLAAIPIGIGVNLLTPWVKTKLSTYSQARRETRIKKIQTEYLTIQAFRQGRDTNKLIVRVAMQIIYMVSFLAFTIIFFIFALYATIEYGLRASLANNIVSSAPFVTQFALALGQGYGKVVK